MPVPESLQHIPQWTLYLGGVTSSLLLELIFGEVFCNDWSKACGSMCSKMFNRQNQTGKGQRAKTGISEAGQRRKQYQAEVGGHRHRSEFQGRASPGSNTEITNSRLNNAQKCQPGQEQDFAVLYEVCCLYVCV